MTFYQCPHFLKLSWINCNRSCLSIYQSVGFACNSNSFVFWPRMFLFGTMIDYEVFITTNYSDQRTEYSSKSIHKYHLLPLICIFLKVNAEIPFTPSYLHILQSHCSSNTLYSLLSVYSLKPMLKYPLLPLICIFLKVNAKIPFTPSYLHILQSHCSSNTLYSLFSAYSLKSMLKYPLLPLICIFLKVNAKIPLTPSYLHIP